MLSKPAVGTSRDLLIVTPDRLGAMRVGLGMRHWEIARALSRAGLRVTLASTRPIAGDCEPAEFTVVEMPQSPQEQLRLARDHATVMVQGTVLDSHPALAEVDRPLVADMVCPLHIENLSLPEKDPYLHGLRAVSQCLQRGDFFVCGNERQRLYWLGMLTAIGRLDRQRAVEDPEFRRLVDVVRFGIPDQPPQKTRQVLKGVRRGIGADDFVLVWFGGIWDWLDPAPLIRAVHAAHQHNPRIKLFFSMYRRPNEQPHAAAVRARRLCQELGAEDRSVFFNELPIPYGERADYLLECDLGVIVQPANLETTLAARKRAMDYLWAGMPMLINRGDEIADMVAQHGMGIVLQGDDPTDIEQALLEYAEDRPRQQRAAAAVVAVAAHFRWSQTVKPLEEFCRSVIGQQRLRKAA
jgi:glycosyltransferase involved in cell wall biosynthesis